MNKNVPPTYILELIDKFFLEYKQPDYPYIFLIKLHDAYIMRTITNLTKEDILMIFKAIELVLNKINIDTIFCDVNKIKNEFPFKDYKYTTLMFTISEEDGINIAGNSTYPCIENFTDIIEESIEVLEEGIEPVDTKQMIRIINERN